ncbi:MAG TPA: hypothetical protein VJR71_16980 [Pseudolabrys sp.]|nr:hypothetical protein [Pseudolabrys sp.]
MEPSGRTTDRGRGVGRALLAAALLAAAVACAVPRAIDSVSGLSDPARMASRALDNRFDAGVAQREIESALEAGDPDLARSFVSLAAARKVPVDPALDEKVTAAEAEAATLHHRAASFARGFVSGEPEDMAGLAGTTVGDLSLFGDVRDALREGRRLASGEKADELMLGLACAGIAITAGTYVTFGAAAPARMGLTLAKIARRTGSISSGFAESVGRLVRKAGLSTGEMRTARDAVETGRAGGLVSLAGNIGRIGSAAGGRAALDSLKIAKDPRDIARIVKLSEKEGSRTRAILKVAGRGAIMAAALGFEASSWLLGAVIAVFGFVCALKGAVERTALRFFRYRRRQRKAMLAIAATPLCS